MAENNASQTSLIPSPLPQRTAISKPRQRVRAAKPAEPQHARPKERPNRSEVPARALYEVESTPQKPTARGTSPIRSIGLSTPPRSRDGSFTESPVETQFSSPPRALTETYERIDQEEDLAATEGAISDPDSEPSEDAPISNRHAVAKHASTELPRFLPRGPDLTPKDTRIEAHGRRAPEEDFTAGSVLSDPTGMSFLNQLSDPNLKLAMTPHVVQSAADKEALRRIWDSKRPIAFGKANGFHLDSNDASRSVENPSQGPRSRLIAFSKAGRIQLANDLALRPHHQRTFSDVTNQIEHASRDVTLHAHNDNWHNDDLKREVLPHNPRIHRPPYFSRTHGFPERPPTIEFDDNIQPSRRVRSESPFANTPLTVSGQPETGEQKTDGTVRSNIKPYPGSNPAEPNSTLDSQQFTQGSTEVDWMQAAADKPIPTIETDSPPRSRSRLSDTRDIDASPEKSRRFDLEFTGQSFQVSESPPVRSKNLPQDPSREKEIRGLVRIAVTTNRLSQIRARESCERLRNTSKSPVPEMEDLSRDEFHNDRDPQTDGERLSDTPTVMRRSNSIGSGKKGSAMLPVRPSPDRSQSHDLLQRIARGSSSTPRSTTPSDKASNSIIANDKQERSKGDMLSEPDMQDETEETIQGQVMPSSDAVKATPKVTGAWTDTVLPETVRTTKQTDQRARYTQTPHVTAGGWVDTPAPANQAPRLEPLLESTQEILEELMNGIGNGGARDSDTVTVTAETIAKAAPQIPAQTAPSLARQMLAEAREKLHAPHLHRHTAEDDSLVLGNATIQSLENVLDMDETDITVLSKIGEEPLSQTDTEVLDRLGTKLDRLRTHLHDASKGISKLESQISQPQEPVHAPRLPDLCEACNHPQSLTQPHVHPQKSSTYFPLTLLTATLPIPLLFHTHDPTSTRKLPRPTPLGRVVIAIWTWYLLECTLAEIYSHPQYASHYTWPSQSEPEFPFVLPTMLWRWSHLAWVYPYLLRPVVNLLIGMVRMVGIWLGLIDGFAEGPADMILENVVETLYQQAETGAGAGSGGGGVGGGGGGGGLYMTNDELL